MFAASAGARAGSISRASIAGHSIGESAAAFLSAEPEAQRKVDACRQSAEEPSCAQLLAALDGRERAEVSTGDSMAFLLEEGKLVRITMPADRAVDAEVTELTKQIGHRPRQIAIAGQSVQGAKWHNSLFVWDAADATVTLYQDNDPSLQDRRPLLVIEARPHRKGDTVSVKQLVSGKQMAGHAGTNPSQAAALR
jgi:hypothetical protein